MHAASGLFSWSIQLLAFLQVVSLHLVMYLCPLHSHAFILRIVSCERAWRAEGARGAKPLVIIRSKKDVGKRMLEILTAFCEIG